MRLVFFALLDRTFVLVHILEAAETLAGLRAQFVRVGVCSANLEHPGTVREKLRERFALLYCPERNAGSAATERATAEPGE